MIFEPAAVDLVATMTRTTLTEAFVQDHRVLTQGLSRLLSLVEEESYQEATRLARELDDAVGAHIEFEEKSFYPEVQKSRGRAYVENLYDEHRSGERALRFLSGLKAGTAPTPEERGRLIADLRRALDHAVSCGTLLSHVSTLPGREQQAFLDELERFRALSHRWTELHPDD